MAEDVEQHMTELTWLMDELQDEIETLDTTKHAQVHRVLALDLTDAIIRRALLLRRAVAAAHKSTNRLSVQELARLLGVWEQSRSDLADILARQLIEQGGKEGDDE